jgi:hypothetical protein
MMRAKGLLMDDALLRQYTAFLFAHSGLVCKKCNITQGGEHKGVKYYYCGCLRKKADRFFLARSEAFMMKNIEEMMKELEGDEE